MDKGFHGESDESRPRMQVRASLGFAAFVLARRKLPAVRRFDLPITGHTLHFSDYSIKVFVNNKNFEWQTPLTMDDFQAVLLTGVETTRNCYDSEALAYTRQ